MPSEANCRVILVVDDDDVIGNVLRRVLERDGYSVHLASSPAGALSCAAERTPDLALLDLSYPNGDGVDLADDLRARYADLPLILMTAYPLRLRERPEAVGRFRQVLQKPLDLPQLRKAISETLNEVDHVYV